MSARIVDKDLGFDKIMQEMATLKRKPFIKAGLVKELGGSEIKTERDGKSTGLTVAQVATYNEFGLGVPERSFVRSTFDEEKRIWINITNKIKNEILLGRSTVKRGLGQLGLILETDIKKKIKRGDFIPNAPSTIAKKGSTRPLIDTGQMIQSIKHKVFL